MMIGSVDYKTVRQETKKECRKQAEDVRSSRALEIRESNISLSNLNMKKKITATMMYPYFLLKRHLP